MIAQESVALQENYVSHDLNVVSVENHDLDISANWENNGNTRFEVDLLVPNGVFGRAHSDKTAQAQDTSSRRRLVMSTRGEQSSP